MATGPVDWERLMAVSGASEGQGSSAAARRAISALLPVEVIHDAVDTYVHGRPGAELARSILWRIKPGAARDRCLEIYRREAPVADRRAAVELFRVIALAQDLPRIHEFLADPDPEIQTWGMLAVDQMIVDGDADEDSARSLLEAGAAHPNPQVRQVVSDIVERHRADG